MFLQGLYQQKHLNANSAHKISKMQAAGNFKSLSGVVVFCICLLFYTTIFTFFCFVLFSKNHHSDMFLTLDLNQYLHSCIMFQETQTWSYVLFLLLCDGGLNYFCTLHLFEL